MLVTRLAQLTRSPCVSLSWRVFDLPSAMFDGNDALGTQISSLVVSPNWSVLLVPSAIPLIVHVVGATPVRTGPAVASDGSSTINAAAASDWRRGMGPTACRRCASLARRKGRGS